MGAPRTEMLWGAGVTKDQEVGHRVLCCRSAE